MSSLQRRADPLVYLLVILFGVASWVDINGLWVELPILVQKLPEGWALPSFMVVIAQMANVAPLIYTIVKIRWPHRLPEKGVIYVIISVGVAACVLLVFFWDRTSVVGGVRRSTALLSLNLFLALVDTTSSVAFLPFMAVFKHVYMTAYFIGEGMSGLLPAMIGLAQGAGRIECVNITVNNSVINSDTNDNSVHSSGTFYKDIVKNYTIAINGEADIRHSSFVSETMLIPKYVDLNFSIEVFFVCIGIMIFTSGVSFTILNYSKRCRNEYFVRYIGEVLSMVKSNKKAETESKSNSVCVKKQHESLMPWEEEHNPALGTEEVLTNREMSRVNYITCLVLTGYLSAVNNAILPSVQSYSSLPYGNAPFHLSVTLINIANPLACFLAFFVYVTSVPALLAISLIGTMLGTYIMAAAVMSPTPFLVDTKVGGALIVTVWVVCIFLTTYVRVCLASLFRKEGKKGLICCGAAQQVGSFAGGVLSFVLVNVLHIFVMADMCQR